MARGFECTFEELDAIGAALQLDVRPFPFQFPIHGEMVDERIRMLAAAHDTLTAKGLIEGRRFAPDLEDQIGLFARGRVAIAVVGSSDGDGLCARAVSDGRHAVLAVQRDEAVEFTPVTPAALVRTVLRLLPPLRSGPGRSVTVTADQPAARRPRDEDLTDRRYLQTVRPPMDSTSSQRAIAEEILRRPRVGSGYLTVTARGRNGKQGEPMTMSWLDTTEGRYAVLPTTSADGRLHVTYTPADLPRMSQSLSRLVDQLS